MNFLIEKKYLSLLGIPIKNETKSHLNIRCKICGDSQKNKHKARGFVLKDSPMKTASYYCHNCGVSLSFYSFIGEVGDKSIAKRYLNDYNKTKLQSFKFKSSEQKPIKEKPKQIEIPKVIDLYDVPVIITDLNDKCKEYLRKRKIDEKDWKYFKSIKDHNILMILSFTQNTLAGYQLRYLDQKKFFIHLYDEHKIWGYDRIKTNEPVYIFEGTFDALSVNLISVSSMGADFNHKIAKKQIYCFDNDKTGHEKALQYAERGYDVLVHDKKFPFKDMNEALMKGVTKEQLTKYILTNIKSSLKATLELRLKF